MKRYLSDVIFNHTYANANKYAEAKKKGIRPGSLGDNITYRGTNTYADRSMPYHY